MHLASAVLILLMGSLNGVWSEKVNHLTDINVTSAEETHHWFYNVKVMDQVIPIEKNEHNLIQLPRDSELSTVVQQMYAATIFQTNVANLCRLLLATPVAQQEETVQKALLAVYNLFAHRRIPADSISPILAKLNSAHGTRQQLIVFLKELLNVIPPEIYNDVSFLLKNIKKSEFWSRFHKGVMLQLPGLTDRISDDFMAATKRRIKQPVFNPEISVYFGKLIDALFSSIHKADAVSNMAILQLIILHLPCKTVNPESAILKRQVADIILSIKEQSRENIATQMKNTSLQNSFRWLKEVLSYIAQIPNVSHVEKATILRYIKYIPENINEIYFPPFTQSPLNPFSVILPTADLTEVSSKNIHKPISPTFPDLPSGLKHANLPKLPGHPGSPHKPGSPLSPSSPDKPYSSTTGGLPGQPNSPNKPESPLSPYQPGKPNTPHAPNSPDLPGGSKLPLKPGSPNLPSNPKKPHSPDYPGSPDFPEHPNFPDKPESPHSPSSPDMPHSPHSPTSPDLPNQPTLPDKPKVPKSPKKPNDPLSPELPRKPIMTGKPNTPLSPDTPMAPSSPGLPNKPNLPDKPYKPHSPASPDIPTLPTKPSSPSKPASPGLPGKPVQPDKPSEPIYPNSPQAPDLPSQPFSPRPPTLPDKPSKPISPSSPAAPDLPRRPGLPGKPDLPGKPSSPRPPTLPDKPYAPVSPSSPAAPDLPRRPDLPGKSDLPRKPSSPRPPTLPDKPSAPISPSSPVAPDLPRRPDLPGTPDLPRKPSSPRPPTLPDKPSAPISPSSPAAPDLPRQPDLPGKPDLPRKPGSPIPPTLPDTPSAPISPSSPAAPDLPRRPDLPGKPDLPRKPGSPRPPTLPGTPSAPISPSSPAAPDLPRRPDLPGKPDLPRKPGTPRLSTVPEKPFAPYLPSLPMVPGSPRQPDLPGQPTLPFKPSAPVSPNSPATPDIPRKPHLPGKPTLPSTPISPGRADTPNIPTQPDTPSTPLSPISPNTPNLPGPPILPDKPYMPVSPNRPNTPTIPTAPDKARKPYVPDKPSVSNSPNNPVSPEVPIKPELPHKSFAPAPPGSPNYPNSPGSPSEPYAPFSPSNLDGPVFPDKVFHPVLPDGSYIPDAPYTPNYMALPSFPREPTFAKQMLEGETSYSSNVEKLTFSDGKAVHSNVLKLPNNPYNAYTPYLLNRPIVPHKTFKPEAHFTPDVPKKANLPERVRLMYRPSFPRNSYREGRPNFSQQKSLTSEIVESGFTQWPMTLAQEPKPWSSYLPEFPYGRHKASSTFSHLPTYEPNSHSLPNMPKKSISPVKQSEANSLEILHTTYSSKIPNNSPNFQKVPREKVSLDILNSKLSSGGAISAQTNLGFSAEELLPMPQEHLGIFHKVNATSGRKHAFSNDFFTGTEFSQGHSLLSTAQTGSDKQLLPLKTNYMGNMHQSSFAGETIFPKVTFLPGAYSSTTPKKLLNRPMPSVEVFNQHKAVVSPILSTITHAAPHSHYDGRQLDGSVNQQLLISVPEPGLHSVSGEGISVGVQHRPERFNSYVYADNKVAGPYASRGSGNGYAVEIRGKDNALLNIHLLKKPFQGIILSHIHDQVPLRKHLYIPHGRKSSPTFGGSIRPSTRVINRYRPSFSGYNKYYTNFTVKPEMILQAPDVYNQYRNRLGNTSAGMTSSHWLGSSNARFSAGATSWKPGGSLKSSPENYRLEHLPLSYENRASMRTSPASSAPGYISPSYQNRGYSTGYLPSNYNNRVFVRISPPSYLTQYLPPSYKNRVVLMTSPPSYSAGHLLPNYESERSPPSAYDFLQPYRLVPLCNMQSYSCRNMMLIRSLLKTATIKNIAAQLPRNDFKTRRSLLRFILTLVLRNNLVDPEMAYLLQCYLSDLKVEPFIDAVGGLKGDRLNGRS